MGLPAPLYFGCLRIFLANSLSMTRQPPESRKPLARRIAWEEIDRGYLERLVGTAREEDLAGAGLATPPGTPGDVTTDTVIPRTTGTARLVAREDLRLCGVQLAPLVLEVYGAGAPFRAELRASDGDDVAAGTEIAVLEGDLPILLTAERVLLNFLQHLSGVATNTRRHVEALGDSPTRLLDTRKTTPGFRVLEKYAVACGGGWNHRMGLFDRIMVKDNHLAAGARERVEGLRRTARERPDLVIEIEVDRPDQIPFALEAEPDVILLDNFSPDELREAVAAIGGRCATEASGGVRLETLPSLGKLGLDFISCGALTHGSAWTDIALDWRE